MRHFLVFAATALACTMILTSASVSGDPMVGATVGVDNCQSDCSYQVGGQSAQCNRMASFSKRQACTAEVDANYKQCYSDCQNQAISHVTVAAEVEVGVGQTRVECLSEAEREYQRILLPCRMQPDPEQACAREKLAYYRQRQARCDSLPPHTQQDCMATYERCTADAAICAAQYRQCLAQTQTSALAPLPKNEVRPHHTQVEVGDPSPQCLSSCQVSFQMHTNQCTAQSYSNPVGAKQCKITATMELSSCRNRCYIKVADAARPLTCTEVATSCDKACAANSKKGVYNAQCYVDCQAKYIECIRHPSTSASTSGSITPQPVEASVSVAAAAVATPTECLTACWNQWDPASWCSYGKRIWANQSVCPMIDSKCTKRCVPSTPNPAIVNAARFVRDLKKFYPEVSAAPVPAPVSPSATCETLCNVYVERFCPAATAPQNCARVKQACLGSCHAPVAAVAATDFIPTPQQVLCIAICLGVDGAFEHTFQVQKCRDECEQEHPSLKTEEASVSPAAASVVASRLRARLAASSSSTSASQVQSQW